MNTLIHIFPVGSGILTDNDLEKLSDWNDKAFSHLSVANDFEWTVGGHYNLRLEVDNEFAGYVGVLRREILIDGNAVVIGAIRGLIINDTYRGLRLGRLLMEAAQKVIFNTVKAEHGFLICLREISHFYRKLGWQEIGGSISLENKGELVEWPEAAMILPGAHSMPNLCACNIDLKGKAF